MQLIDAGMIAFAAWHALKRRVDHPLTFQVPRMLRKVVQEAEDTYALFWNGENLWKRDRWPPYRDRPEIWDEAGRDDFDAMLDVLAGLGVPQYRTDTLEADELLAAVTHRLEGTEPLIIRSDDKDFMQLLTETTGMYGRVRGAVRSTDVEKILGVGPAFVADFLALAGDKADGIPRIVTPAVARDVIHGHGPIRDWIDGELPAAMGTSDGEATRGQIRLNFELVDLSPTAVNAPPPLPADAGDLERVREIGERLKITYLTEDSLAGDFAILREWGDRSRARLRD